MKSIRSFRSKLWSSTALVLGAALVFSLSAFSPSSGAQAKKNKYIGAAKCKNCHSAEETGNQYDAWTKMTHAKAWETLGGEEAKKVAAAKGIADPQKEDACLKCHVTGHGVDAAMIGKGFKFEMGVQCESCHGPGDNHMKARMMAAAAEGEPPPVTAEEIQLGSPAVCVGCHNAESPSYKPFCYFKARDQIAHLNPQRKNRTAEEQKLLDSECGCGDKCPTPECAEGKCGVPKKK